MCHIDNGRFFFIYWDRRVAAGIRNANVALVRCKPASILGHGELWKQYRYRGSFFISILFLCLKKAQVVRAAGPIYAN